ncbi:CoA-substrate-specific enzyme activase, putative [Desulfacinum hydrothermale DSM 13146]|uniref:CoA-substrate-specific enzyme activase, putative n=1 Tax=Desulfacinum hydrothermale DSM 13146 TaxID=1121390 RepID=A0A1W1WZ30_9BACT|nr:acyl-CoA dehydratase activase [Desulfacinum hydrothermale]SMC16982.1 CoA-substrate-specific enzyme activase, putative [Desulfacinum hydrothermale DSM 13146]
MRTLDVGVDVGSVSINCVVVEDGDRVVWEAPYRRHFGLVIPETRGLLQSVLDRFGGEAVRSVSFTGVHGERLARLLSAPYEVETVAQVLGAVHVVPGVRTIISIGGQDACLFQLDYDGDQWYLEAFNMNGPCASGTGSFIDQQGERLATSLYGPRFEMSQEKIQKTLDDFIRLGLQYTNPAPVACRCTVFTKSDMIHLQNKGEPLPNIIAGLHFGNAANYVSTIVANRQVREPIVFIGGMASNRLQVEAFRRYYPSLQVPPHHTCLGALGAALQAHRAGLSNRVELDLLAEGSAGEALESFPRAPRLELHHTRFDPQNDLEPWGRVEKNPLPVFLGVDIGSTTTKYALIDGDGVIRHKCYVQTQGKPIQVTRRLLQTLLGEVGSRVRILAVATTGSGRNVVGDFLDADLVMDEITAHARGAVAVDPLVDTIFEIGGQDSKYIRIDNTHPLDFDMNKVCAAGTGSFLHELANKMKINIVGEFQEIALSAQNPVHLAERCTVFMESDLFGYYQKGARRDDLIAGLCYAVVHNYLNRVVGKRRIGQRIMFLGGPSLNKAVVAAFERVLNRPLIVPRHREVMGAYGAALAVKEALERGEVSPKERDLERLAQAQVSFVESVCRADRACHNECKLKIYDFAGRKSVWGGDCGRYEVSHHRGPKAENAFEIRRRLFGEALDAWAVRADEMERSSDSQEAAWKSPSARNASRPTVGVPLGLHALEWGPFWVRLLAGLGLRVVVSPPTDTRMVRAGLESMTAETCFPVKVFHGHVRFLAHKCHYLFLPNVIDMPGPRPDEAGMFCPLVESSQYMVRAALGLDDGHIIRPTLYLREGPDALAPAVHRSLPASLGCSPEQVARAVRQAWDYQKTFRERLLEAGRDYLERIPHGEPVWIITGRPYNLHDSRLNLQLGRHLARLGIWAMPADMIAVDDEDLSDFPRMYWGLGARILRTAKKIARTPTWFGVHMTNFSCGADSFLEHFYKHVLTHKPALILELDEHSAVAGMLTRVEAYRNVVKNVCRETLEMGVPEAFGQWISN